jgi:ABC-type molybdate transport system substrate-binding protein
MRINIYIIILLLIILLICSFIAPITAFFVAIFSDEKHSFQTLESLSTFAGAALTLVFKQYQRCLTEFTVALIGTTRIR